MNMQCRLSLVICAIAVAGCTQTETNMTTESTYQRDPIGSVQPTLADLPDVIETNAEGEAPSNFADANTESTTVDKSPGQNTKQAPEQRTFDSNGSETQTSFNEMMTAAHQALEQEHWQEASRFLEEALERNPNSAAARDLLVFVTKQQELINQQALTEKFTSAVQAERWIEANDIAKNINLQSSEILTQVQRCEALIRAEKLADRLLSNPERLSRPSIQTEVMLLHDLTNNVDLGERVGEKVTRLNELSQRWTTPVVINLNSDGYTNVLLRPGRNLGRFRSQKIELMPGNYQLIGRRNGYREVLRELRLTPNGDVQTIEIKAVERF